MISSVSTRGWSSTRSDMLKGKRDRKRKQVTAKEKIPNRQEMALIETKSGPRAGVSAKTRSPPGSASEAAKKNRHRSRPEPPDRDHAADLSGSMDGRSESCWRLCCRKAGMAGASLGLHIGSSAPGALAGRRRGSGTATLSGWPSLARLSSKPYRSGRPAIEPQDVRVSRSNPG